MTQAWMQFLKDNVDHFATKTEYRMEDFDRIAAEWSMAPNLRAAQTGRAQCTPVGRKAHVPWTQRR